MVKVLICGDISDNWEVVFQRVRTLQKSSHGPFHCMFCTGKVFKDIEDFERFSSKTKEMPILTYMCDYSNIFSFASDGSLNYTNPIPQDLVVLKTNKLLTLEQLTIAIYDDNDDNMESMKAIASSGAYVGCDLMISRNWPKDVHQFLDESDYLARDSIGIPLGVGSTDVGDMVMLLRPRYHLVSGFPCFYQRPPFNIDGNEAAKNAPCVTSRFISLGQVTTSKDKQHKWLHALSLNPITHMNRSELCEGGVSSCSGSQSNGVGECPYVKINSLPKRKGVTEKPSLTSNAKRIKMEDNSVSSSSAAAAASPSSFFFHDASRGQPGGGNMSGSYRNNVPLTSSAPSDLEPPSNSIKTLFIGNIPYIRSNNKSYYGNSNSHEPTDYPDADIVQALFPTIIIRGSMKHTAEVMHQHHQGSTQSRFPIKDVAEVVRSFHRPNATDSASTQNQKKKSFAFVECFSHEDAAAVVEYAKTCCIVVADNNRTISVGWGKEERFGMEDANGVNAGKGTVKTYNGKLSANRLVLNTRQGTTDCSTLFIGNIPAGQTSSDNINEAFKKQLLDVFNRFLSDNKARERIAEDDITMPSGRGFAFVNFKNAYLAQYVMDQVVRSQEEVDKLVTAGRTGEEQQQQQQQQALVEEYLSTNYPFQLTSTSSTSPAVMLSIGWTKGNNNSQHSNKEDTHAQDCWFCLSSPQVKVHMIMSISDHCYVALARGGVCEDTHVLIVPIECVPNRLHITADCKTDMMSYEKALAQMFADTPRIVNTDATVAVTAATSAIPSPPPPPSTPKPPFYCIKFERAIRTKGSKNHMQLQLVPLPFTYFLSTRDKADQGSVSEHIQTFLNIISKYNLQFIELPSIEVEYGHESFSKMLSVDEALVNMEGGPCEEYFYIEIPEIEVDTNNNTDINNSIKKITYRRYLYVHEENAKSENNKGIVFPMHLGNEVAACIYKKPERSNWKKCVLSTEEEVSIVNTLKGRFGAFDFTG